MGLVFLWHFLVFSPLWSPSLGKKKSRPRNRIPLRATGGGMHTLATPHPPPLSVHAHRDRVTPGFHVDTQPQPPKIGERFPKSFVWKKRLQHFTRLQPTPGDSKHGVGASCGAVTHLSGGGLSGGSFFGHCVACLTDWRLCVNSYGWTSPSCFPFWASKGWFFSSQVMGRFSESKTQTSDLCCAPSPLHKHLRRSVARATLKSCWVRALIIAAS
jgi:hypothetical protein